MDSTQRLEAEMTGMGRSLKWLAAVVTSAAALMAAAAPADAALVTHRFDNPGQERVLLPTSASSVRVRALGAPGPNGESSPVGQSHGGAGALVYGTFSPGA